VPTAYKTEAFPLNLFALFAVFIPAGSSLKLIDYSAINIVIFFFAVITTTTIINKNTIIIICTVWNLLVLSSCLSTFLFACHLVSHGYMYEASGLQENDNI
jgi:hypothetical protein